MPIWIQFWDVIPVPTVMFFGSSNNWPPSDIFTLDNPTCRNVSFDEISTAPPVEPVAWILPSMVVSWSLQIIAVPASPLEEEISILDPSETKTVFALTSDRLSPHLSIKTSCCSVVLVKLLLPWNSPPMRTKPPWLLPATLTSADNKRM